MTDRAVVLRGDALGGAVHRPLRMELAPQGFPLGPVLIRPEHADTAAAAPVRPALVVDPFCGTGTTMLTASMLGRIGIGVDMSADYCRLARWRCSDPGERAKALQVPKPPPVPDGQGSLFDDEAV